MTDLPSDALRVVATIPSDPAKSESVRSGLTELATASLREEEGCLSYEVFESEGTPGTFVTIEAWRSMDDMNAHLSTPHVAAAFGFLGDALTGDLAIHTLKPLG
jgi:quinol monooxygenase YgiN